MNFLSIRSSEFFNKRAEVHKGWRQHLHQQPETAFEEYETADFLAAKLEGFGLKVTRGLSVTGLFATLEGRADGPSIGFRADMDALPIQEQSKLPYRSTNKGVTHACGHDGHMAMLLAAAEYLSQNRDFRGTLHFIFQPAEEGAGGGRRMVEDGLFEMAPCDLVFGLHNWPGLSAGTIAVKSGPMMAAMDLFSVEICGAGVHAALPHLGTDAIAAAGALIQALQTIVSRAIDPHDQLVLSITKIHGGHSVNSLPNSVELHGTLRYFYQDVAVVAHRRMEEIVNGIASAHDVKAPLDMRSVYPVTQNDPVAAAYMESAASRSPVLHQVLSQFTPSTASEDFAFMLSATKGAYAWIGNGRSTALHDSSFDFNDEILPAGAAYWVALAEQQFSESNSLTLNDKSTLKGEEL